MISNITHGIAPATTLSGDTVVSQKAQSLQVAREFYCYPERATSMTGEFNANMVGHIAIGFLDWYADEVTGENISTETAASITEAAMTAYEIFKTDRDAIATAVAFTTFALIPPTQR